MIRSNPKFRLPMALFGAALAVSTFAAGPAAADTEIVVRDFVLTSAIAGREPVNDAAGFTVQDEKAYAFARIGNGGAPTSVNVVWHHEGTQHGSVWLNVGKSPGWRTWSSANLKPGNWSVSLVDTNGAVLVQRSFTVDQTVDTMAGIDDLMVEEPTSTSTAGDADGTDESAFCPMR
jgi:hypothetical protein